MTSPFSYGMRHRAAPGPVRVGIWEAADASQAPTSETKARGRPDDQMSGAVMIESSVPGVVESAAETLLNMLGPLPAPASIGTFTLIVLMDSL